MQILLEKPELENLIREQIDLGRYDSPTTVVEVALWQLMEPQFAPGELARSVAEGEASLFKYGPLKAEDVFRDLRQMRDPARLVARK